MEETTKGNINRFVYKNLQISNIKQMKIYGQIEKESIKIIT